MNPLRPAPRIQSPVNSFRRLHLLLGIQTLSLVLLFTNRISGITDIPFFASAHIRWSDLLNLGVIPLISIGGFALLKREIDRSGKNLLVNFVFLLGIFLLASSYAFLEAATYIDEMFCSPSTLSTSRLCEISASGQADFYHWIFFSGFILVNAALMFIQSRTSLPGRLSKLDKTLLVANGIFVGISILVVLTFIQTGLEVALLALLALFALEMLRKRNTQPLAVYYATAFWLGLIGVGLIRAF